MRSKLNTVVRYMMFGFRVDVAISIALAIFFAGIMTGLLLVEYL